MCNEYTQLFCQISMNRNIEWNNNHLLVYLKSLTHARPEPNTLPQTCNTSIEAQEMGKKYITYGLTISLGTPQIPLLSHVLCKPQKLHISFSDLVSTHLRTSSPTFAMRKINCLAPPYWCVYTPPLNMPILSSLVYLIFSSRGATPVFSLHSTFLTLSNLVSPHIH